MNELTSFQRDLVYCIAALEGPSGMEVGRELEEYTVAEVNHGRLYPNLNELVEEGLVEKKKERRPDEPVYAHTTGKRTDQRASTMGIRETARGWNRSRLNQSLN